MKNTKFLTLTAATALGLLSSCSKNEGESLLTYSFNVNKTESTATNYKTASNANTLEITGGFALINDVEFEGEHKEKGEVEIEAEVSATLDLATGNLSPQMTGNIPAGDYYETELEVEVGSETDGVTLQVEGTWTDENDSIHTVIFEYKDDFTFEAEMGNVTITDGHNPTASINLDVYSWFSPVTNSMWNNAVSTNGEIVISSTSNEALFDIIVDKIDDVSEVEYDEDDDDDDEDDEDEYEND